MNSRFLPAARMFGAISIGVIALSAVSLLLSGASGVARHPVAIGASLLLIYWLAEPLIRRPVQRAPAAASPPSDTSEQPRNAIAFDVTEREWIAAKLLYRGVHTLAGVTRRIVLALPIVSLLYFALAWFTARLPGDAAIEPFRDPATAAAIIVVLAAVLSLIDNFYRAPLVAAAVYRANAARWWPAEIGWNDAAIFIKNNEGRFRYALRNAAAGRKARRSFCFTASTTAIGACPSARLTRAAGLAISASSSPRTWRHSPL